MINPRVYLEAAKIVNYAHDNIFDIYRFSCLAIEKATMFNNEDPYEHRKLYESFLHDKYIFRALAHQFEFELGQLIENGEVKAHRETALLFMYEITKHGDY